MNKRSVLTIGLVVSVGLVLAAFATSEVGVFSSPGGEQIGSWSGPVTVLAVEGDWAQVRMIGWMPKAQVAQGAPSGTRIVGSPGGGLWITNERITKDYLGDAKITGWMTNATGNDFEGLFINIVLVDSGGAVIDSILAAIRNIADGATMGFSEDTFVDYDLVAKVMFQFSSGW